MPSRHTLVTAFVGAIVGVVLSSIPFSTALGGAVAGFLEGPDGRDGTIAGTLAGLFMFVPMGLLAVAFLFILGFGFGLAGLPLEGFVLLTLVLGFAVSVVLVYTVGLAAIGGYLGAYLARQYPKRRTSTREAMRMRSTRPERRPRPEERSGPTRWHESRDESGAYRHETEFDGPGADSDRLEVEGDRFETELDRTGPDGDSDDRRESAADVADDGPGSPVEADDGLESPEDAADVGSESREKAADVGSESREDDDRPGE